MTTTTEARPAANRHGYQLFRVGDFEFERDEFFAHIRWPTADHVMSVDAFLRALQRDVAWNFFYGTVNFDGVFGTINHYGTVDVFAGRSNEAYRKAGLDFTQRVGTDEIRAVFSAMVDDWTNEGFDPFASPSETGSAFGAKHGANTEAVTRRRVAAARMVSLPGDEVLRTDDNGHPVNRGFADVAQDEPEVRPAPGYEGRIGGFNLAAYLSRSPVTWNPSVVSVCGDSLLCPTSEEYILPVIHGNDRPEWFVQLSDEITWDVEDGATGARRATVVMKPGDVSVMPADIRHRGYAAKRSMLLVWENASAALPDLIAEGKVPLKPVAF